MDRHARHTLRPHHHHHARLRQVARTLVNFCCAFSGRHAVAWRTRCGSRQEAAGSPAPGMAPSRPYDGCHGAGDGPPPQRTAGGGAERGSGGRAAPRATATEASTPGDTAGASFRGVRAAGEGSYGRLRGCPGAYPLHAFARGHHGGQGGRPCGAAPPPVGPEEEEK